MGTATIAGPRVLALRGIGGGFGNRWLGGQAGARLRQRREQRPIFYLFLLMAFGKRAPRQQTPS